MSTSKKTAYMFDLPQHQSSIIKAIGVGGGGSNAVTHMFLQGIKGVEFFICNTDMQALNASPVPNKLQIGATLTEGLGCGANPEVGHAAALESEDQIREILEGAKMVFVTSGMGGGTGTGAAPVIAQIAKKMDILTVGIVTLPFAFEGKEKQIQAAAGIKELRKNCDTLLIILNDKLREIYGNLSIGQAFSEADSVLTTAAKGIAEIITLTGYVNVDFQDVRTVMFNAGAAVMGSADTQGENRAIEGAKRALDSPLLDDKNIMGAKRILLSIVSGEEAQLQMDELTQITEYIQQEAGQQAEMIFGHSIDPAIGDRIRITIIATGFTSEKENEEEKKNEIKVQQLDSFQQSFFDEIDASVNNHDTEVTLKITDQSELDLWTQSNELITEKNEQRSYEFTFPQDEEEDHSQNNFFDIQHEHESLYEQKDEEVNLIPENMVDFPTNQEQSISHEQIKKRLHQQAEERRNTIYTNKKTEISREEYDRKWSLPAYLRKGVKMNEVPHSSESYVSKYNLNDDNKFLGNNKFLHDNVD